MVAFLNRWCCWTRPTRGMDIREERVRTRVSLDLPFHPCEVLKRCFLVSGVRANVVIGDIFTPGAQNIVEAISKLPPGSGKACWKRCDVTSWEDQVALFELAMTKFGGIDIVVSVPPRSGCVWSGGIDFGWARW